MILGNLGMDPELKYTPQGSMVCNFNVASNRKYNDGNGVLVEETIWFRVSAWGKSAEAVSTYLHKGDPVFIEGRLRPDVNGNPNIWMKSDGSAGASFEVSASTIKFINGSKKGQTVVVDSVPAPQQAQPTRISQPEEIEV